MPRSAIIWRRSRELSLNVRYHRTHRPIISWSKCRPLKSSCAEAGSVIKAVTAGSRAFQVCTRTQNVGWELTLAKYKPAMTEKKTDVSVGEFLDAARANCKMENG